MTDKEMVQAIEAARLALNDLLSKAAQSGLTVELEAVPADKVDLRYSGDGSIRSVVTVAPHVTVKLGRHLFP